jgi:Homocysteine S-methyltransferase
VRSLCDLPVIAQMTIGTDGLTHYGTEPAAFTKQLADWGADVIGVNCSVGPAGLLEAVEKMVKVTDRPISAVPNAGLPKDVGDRKIYLASPEHMATYARRMIEAGARFVGGCCGTTPEHIKKIRDYVASVVPRHQPTVVSRDVVAAPAGSRPWRSACAPASPRSSPRAGSSPASKSYPPRASIRPRCSSSAAP